MALRIRPFWESSTRTKELPSDPRDLQKTIANKERQHLANESVFLCDPWHPEEMFTPPTARNTNRFRPLPLATNASKSTVKIVNPKKQYHVCDHVTIRIDAKDKHGTQKQYGGDFFRIKLFTPKPYSAIGPEYFIDYDNGTYFAHFILRWEGQMKVSVLLVHPSEAIPLLNRTTQGSAMSLFTFFGTFQTTKDGHKEKEDVTCGVAAFPPPSCNVSAKRTHGPWFCQQPKNKFLTCDDWAYHYMDMKVSSRNLENSLNSTEKTLFKSSKVSLTGNRLPSFQVLDGGSSAKVSFPYCSAVHPPKSLQTSGYILQNKWQPFNCSVKKFNADNIESCLRGKTMHLYGDSTARQMFYYLRDNITCNSKEPFLCVGNETTVHFKFHGLPVRGKSVVDAKKIRYIAEEIDDLKGGPGVVIILSVWAHFGLPKGTFYRDRLIAIKQAVERLWIRSPETRVVIRSANTREHSIKGFILISSDWIALQGEKTLRSVFGGDDRFLFLDVWDLTLVQQPKDQIHPSEPTLTQMMDYLLTLLCDP